MREISPAVNETSDLFLKRMPRHLQDLVCQIRTDKMVGTRPKPSEYIVDRSSLMTRGRRHEILDKVASLVDENLCGRSEMCTQFAELLSRTLVHLKLPARPICGQAIYYDNNGKELFRWKHAWVRVGQEVIDGNVDCLSENPMVPDIVKVVPYWGPIRQTPIDRKLHENNGVRLDPDIDVDSLWWPELKEWLDGDLQDVAGA